MPHKPSNNPVHVAVAAVFDDAGRVLITLRPDHVHQGGLWEFPGGKIEAGESVSAALARECHEELGIELQQTRPLIRVSHAYPDKSVLLDVWRVDGFTGEAHGKEGQPFKWVKPEQLADFSFPEANLPIIHSVHLPDQYLITPDPGGDSRVFLKQLEKCLSKGVRLVQLRAKSLSQEDYIKLAKQVKNLCVEFAAKLILNSDPEWVDIVDADGVNLTGDRLLALNHRPLPANKLVAASCHTGEDIAHASQIGVDFAMLSPVQATASHPETIPIGWDRFRAMSEHAAFPVYALGGVRPDDLDTAFDYGAQGIAAIRALWD
ncbi:MAG: Nudix family hydrolase [Gammaproteobacteria bacterium]